MNYANIHKSAKYQVFKTNSTIKKIEDWTILFLTSVLN
jgi:hypothetical protein